MKEEKEVPRDLKWEAITMLSHEAKETTMELLYDVVATVISESDVPLVDYDLHRKLWMPLYYC